MDQSNLRLNSTGRCSVAVVRTGLAIAACAALGACSWIPKFSSDQPKSAAPKPQQVTDHGLGRSVVTSTDDTKNVVSFISQSKYGYVRVERAEAAAQGPNDHPVSLNAAQIRAMLAKLQVRRGSADPDPIFTEDELKDLGAPLAEALAKAGPREDITFAVSDKHGGALGPFVARTVTAGRAFYKSGVLNIVFGEIHGRFEDQFLATGWLRPFVSGSRSGKGAGEWAVAPGDNLRYAAADRADWIQLAQVAVAPAAAGASAAPAAGPSTPSSPAPVVVPNRDAVYQDIEKRLTVLKGLRDKGLITEDEFNEKRKAILKDL